MPSSDQETLLKHVLHDPEYDVFRAALLKSTVRAFRKAHPVRRYRAGLALAAALAFAAVSWKIMTERPAPSVVPPAVPDLAGEPGSDLPTLQTFNSVPLAEAQLVTRAGELIIVRTSTSVDLEIVRTSSDPLAVISDRELLGYLRGQGAGLVKQPGGKQLVLFVPAPAGDKENASE